MTADAFMRKHHMHPGELSLETFCRDFREEMSRGLRGERSSLGMFPAFLRCSARPRPGRVLVIDAGGTNLRLARLRYTEERRLVTEEVRRTRMPGTGGAIHAGEMFEAIARELLPLLADCDRGCFCFSYPCEVLPGGDGRVVELTKELEVRGLPGSRLCSPLEEALLRLGAPGRPAWFFEKEKYGGILCDIGSHQIEQYLYFAGEEDAKVTASRIGNYGHPEYPELDDFGDCTITGAKGTTNYFRVDWFTPDGLSTWGDGRTLILGTKGYMELRKYINVASGQPGGNHIYLVNGQGEKYINATGVTGYPFFGQLILDCLNRTENAMTQDHAFKAAELCLQAQKQAEMIRG